MGAKNMQLLYILLISISITPSSVLSELPIPQFPSLNTRELCEGLFFEPLPLPLNERFFIGCIQEEGIILQCNGERIFDPIVRKCIDKNEETTTSEIPSTTSTTTEIPSTTTLEIPTTTPDYSYLCAGINNQFVNHPTDCGFAIYCHNEVAYLRECPINTIFDINISQCRAGNRDTCEFYETTTLPDLNRLCDGLDRVFLQHPTNCRKAIFCFNGVAIESSCRENAIFDIAINDCREGNADTCEFYEPTTPEPDFNRLCEGLVDQFVPHPTNCGIAIFCHNNRAFLRECDIETIFDLTTLLCRPGNRDTCKLYDADIIVQPTQIEDNWKDLCKGQHFNYIRHPHECDKAIFCYHGYSILKECPLNNVFDINTESCIEGNRETCEFTFEKKAPCTDDFLPHESDKSRYYRCKSGVTYSMICKQNQVFDISLSTCVNLFNLVFGESTQIEMRHVYIAILLAFIYTVDAQTNPCSGVWGGNVPHPEICSKYYTCILSVPTERTCGPDTIFSILTSSCVPGNQETCEIYSTETTTYPTVSNTTTSIVIESTTSTSYVNVTTTTEAPPEVDLNAICRNVFFAARPYPNSNYLYVGCVRGMGLVYQCLEKEEFDEDINECVRICEVPDNVCAGTKLVEVIENPCTCTGFIICYNEQVIDKLSCEEGYIFDVEHGECRPGDPKTCTVFNTTTIGITFFDNV